ncbi:sensor histidine kinase [uncultured Aquimarina sp.]|uniref:sensor histidine kinase n=1 Tax=uncultured Aquimarina sp. TaxID=575652 RepID=UPI00261FA7B9|nr:histidine kinase [uncultured Aquimarina sp.]
MPLFNKQKRIQYLGFDDVRSCLIGIFIISFITNYLFNTTPERNTFDLIFIGYAVNVFFTICYWLLTRNILIFLRKKYPDFKDDKKRIIILILLVVCVVVVVDYVGGELTARFIRIFGYSSNHRVELKVLIPIVIITVMVMAIYEAIYLYNRLKKSIREEEQAKQVMIQAQLDTLRNQARPHFLFNSLNTLRDIIDQDSKEEAKVFVDNLSDVYRFIIESGNSNIISLEKELKFAQAYIHIQSERFGENLQVNWDIPEDKLSIMIVPMSLQLLLENAIKHNVVSRSKPLIINIAIIEDSLVVSNEIQAKSTKIPSTKIGLKNIEKRYQLISNKTPVIIDDGENFTVKLPLLNPSNQKKGH